MKAVVVSSAAARRAILWNPPPGDKWPSACDKKACRIRRWPSRAFANAVAANRAMIANLLSRDVAELVKEAEHCWRWRSYTEAVAAAAVAVPSSARHTASTFWLYVGKVGRLPNVKRVAASPRRRLAVAVFITLTRLARRASLVSRIQYAEENLRRYAADLAALDAILGTYPKGTA